MAVAQSDFDDITVDDYVPDNPCPTRVYVNGIRVPAAETDIHIRKEGPLDISRYAETTFASPFRDEDYLSVFETLYNDGQLQPDTLRIDTRVSDGEDSVYRPIFHGVVTGVGSSSHNNERMYKCRAQGPSHYLTKIAASTTFGSGGVTNKIQPKDIVEYVTDELNDKLNLTITPPQSAGESVFSGALNPIIRTFQNFALFFIDDEVVTPKTFTANKHTLDDVIKWFKDKIGGRLWIQPTKDGGEVVWSQNPTKGTSSHKAHYLDGNTQIVNNDALSELRPINTLKVNGRAKKSYTPVGDFEINLPSDQFVKATARHDVLYQRSGNSELLGDTVKKSDGESKQEVENEARSQLKQRIDEATAGTMQVILNSFIQPYDTIEAKPTVDSLTDNEIPSVTYEIQRAHYIAHPNSDTLPYIDLNVGLHTDMQEDITVTSEWRDK